MRWLFWSQNSRREFPNSPTQENLSTEPCTLLFFFLGVKFALGVCSSTGATGAGGVGVSVGGALAMSLALALDSAINRRCGFIWQSK